MYTKTFLSTALAVALASAQNNSQSLNALITNEGELSGLGTLLESYPDLADTLSSAQNITLFAPSNAAISALQRSPGFESITEAQVGALLNYHIVAGEVPSSAITETPTFAHTLLNDTAYTNVTDGQVLAARLSDDTETDESEDSDTPAVVITSGLKTESTVVQADLNYTNGIVHVIDTVLTIPLNVSTTAYAANLTALAGALTAANLVDTLDAASDITVFAPSNDAFSAIGSAAGNLSTQQLGEILQYHVINSTIAYSSSLGNGSVETLGGGILNITVTDGVVFVNSARVINADILISGGVMHVIDSVLNPNNSTQSEPDADEDEPVVQFSGASSAPLGALTSGAPAASTTVTALVATTEDVAQGYPTQTGGAIGTGAGGSEPTGSNSGGGGSGSESSSSDMASMPTGAIGAAALFGGAAFLANL
ncbi:hypothetical protein LTR37_016836 [Vermiconidia calcicola]|uniref:Uncharacterized protein n=1 Tax=Vermiconidia calcicola TaxID=1690605 RepID=A0ACC3MMY4_9PEZI|nr:hypothetical protein LTR37_016836 [Vermiconidia calcicola]